MVDLTPFPRNLLMFCLSSPWFALVLLASVASVNPLRAQAADAALTKVKEVLSMPEDAAEAGTKSVILHGVVTYVTANQGEFTLHDGEACVSVIVAGGALAPDFGAEVEVEGTVVSEPFFEKKHTCVKLAKLTVRGAGTLPEATPARALDVAEFKHLDQWVSVEGTVLQVRVSMSLLTVQLMADVGSCNVLVRDWPRASFPNDWIGGRVRVTGINRAYLPGSRFLSLVAPSPAQLTVVKTGVTDPLDAPATTIGALLKKGPSRERVKLTGTLIGATTGNVFYARGEDGGAFSFYMLHPIDEDKSGRFSTPIIMPKCSVGDVLEVVGIPGSVEPGVHLDYGVVRVVRSGPELAPASSDIGSVVAGNHVHDLVEVQGHLLSLDDVLVAPGRWRTTMKLADSDHRIVAFLDAPTRGALSHLKQDHLLQVRGIVTGAPHFPEIRLWVTKPEDLQSLGFAMDVVTRRLWMGLAIAAVIVITLAGWALMLSRSRKLVRELNASLETRVTERTAELAAAKDELAQALSQERDLNEMKTRFVSLVSHEFRTPLGVTMSAVEVLRHYRERITEEKHEELLEDIHSATLRMSGMMEQVLLLGRAEAGKIDWRPLPLDLPDLCGKLVEEGRSSMHDRCPVHFTFEGNFSHAEMDEALVRHIIGNLLSNAIKYSPEGVPVDFTLWRESDDALVIIKDRGIGIPVADQGMLFGAFHRASNVGEIPGTGLGLLLVKHCVELHQGTISVQSQEGIGTTFTVRLPLGRG